MDLRRNFERLLADLVSTRLGSLGFERKGLTLHRRRAGYVESFNFQGSQYNVRDARCEFFLNVGVAFPDLPRSAVAFLKSGNGMVDRYRNHTVSLVDHSPDVAWATRADALVGELPGRWIVEPTTDSGALADAIASAVLSASQALEPFAARMRLRAAPVRFVSALLRPLAGVAARLRGRG